MENLEVLEGGNENTNEDGEEKELLKELLKEYFFVSGEAFSHEDLNRLAKIESKDALKKKGGVQESRECEIQRCNIKKKIMLCLLGGDYEKRKSFWERNEREYRDHYGRTKENESKSSFETLKYGILNEIIANSIFKQATSGFDFRITTSELDIDNKIDLIGFSERRKMVLLIQVKQEQGLRNGIKVIQEISEYPGDNDEKTEFFQGCQKLKDELGSNNEGIIFVNLWVIIPSVDRKGDGGEYKFYLEEEIRARMGEILEGKTLEKVSSNN